MKLLQNKRRILITGIICIILALLTLSIRGLMGETFFAEKSKKYTVPAGYVLQPHEKDFNFAVVGDSGSRNESLQNIINNIRNSDKNYKFILYVGDLVNDQPMAHFYWLMGEIAPKLKNIPFYMIAGNHDVFANTKTNRFYYRAIFGQDYYWFSYGDTMFIGLDSSERTIKDKQLQWLDNVLTKIRPLYRSCIIFSHVPPTEEEWADKEALKKFKKVLLKSKVDLMLFGHVHYFSQGTFANIPFYTNLASGQTPRKDIKKLGYSTVSIVDNKVQAVEPVYTDYKKEKEDIEIFLIDQFLTEKNAILALYLFIFGILCCAWAWVLNKKGN